MNIKEKSEKYICNTYTRDTVLKEGLNSELWADDNKTYLDFTSGIGVNIFGVSDTEWANEVSRQLYTLSHTSNLYITEPSANLAEKLVLLSAMQKVFFCNSGLEANECAIKAARKYSFDKYKEGRYKIITLKNSFHGRSMGTLSATGQTSLQQGFMPMLDGFCYVNPNDINDLKNNIDASCAVMLELIQGESGVNVLDKDYVKAVKQVCEDNDLLLIVDEVQTGIGRTGSFFAYQQYDILPDIVTSAKGLGGGLPIGAALFGEKCKDILTPGSHGSTFGGNPIVCAGAINILNRIDGSLLNEVKEKGERIKEALLTCAKVKSISGMGLMIGIEIDGDAKEFVKLAKEKGLLILTAKNKIRLLPALNIRDDLLEKGLGILKEILQ